MGYAAEQLKNAFSDWNPFKRTSAPSATYKAYEPKIVDLNEYIKRCEQNIEDDTERPYMLKSMSLKTYTKPSHTTTIEYADILTSPHTLVAGATGCGKSVFLHSLMYELMGSYTPKEMGLVLIDPKSSEVFTLLTFVFAIVFTN